MRQACSEALPPSAPSSWRSRCPGLRRGQRFLLGVLLFSIGVSNGVIPLRAADLLLLDSQTGLGIAGSMDFAQVDADVLPLAGEIDAVLRARGQPLQLPVRGRQPLGSRVAVRVAATGYRPLKTIWRNREAVTSRTVLLTPLEPARLPTPVAEGQLRLSGWVSDRALRRPVAGALISVSHAAARARSGDDGYYELLLPSPPVRAGRPAPVTVRVEAAGFATQVIADRLFASGAARLNAVLGENKVRPRGHRQLQTRIPGPKATADEPGSAVPRAIGDVPPASITVGFADASCTQRCCSASCSHSCTMSLEDYVRRGLPEEWIASWNHDALAAGAVAYRSYGAWHVFNPPQAAFDVCSSACCQVNEPGTQSSTDAAVAATRGLMLKREGQIFRSEYSAQNNNLLGALSCVNQDLSCGNGFAGSPETGWPCLADPVSTDQACFGHGRGMSQWGNQYWSQSDPPRRWKWQLNHYYNDSGQGSGLRTAEISRVLVIDALRILPGQAGPSSVVLLELDVRNLASETHSAVMIGASLRQPPAGFIDDPANDQGVVLPPGASTVSRVFELPAGLPDGLYDVYVSLYLDVDGDGGISSVDLAQQLLIEASGLSVLGGVFSDRFESSSR